MKINESKRQYKLENLKIGECFRDEHGEIYIKTDDYECVNENKRMILCVSLESGETVRFYNEEEIEHLPNACLNIEE
jgi:hypothetical protein